MLLFAVMSVWFPNIVFLLDWILGFKCFEFMLPDFCFPFEKDYDCYGPRGKTPFDALQTQIPKPSPSMLSLSMLRTSAPFGDIRETQSSMRTTSNTSLLRGWKWGFHGTNWTQRLSLEQSTPGKTICRDLTDFWLIELWNPSALLSEKPPGLFAEGKLVQLKVLFATTLP